jgi:hypothetical protein
MTEKGTCMMKGGLFCYYISCNDQIAVPQAARNDGIGKIAL